MRLVTEPTAQSGFNLLGMKVRQESLAIIEEDKSRESRVGAKERKRRDY